MIRAVTGDPLITGLNDNHISDQQDLLIWPNPASDFIKVKLMEQAYPSSVFISIIDLAGHELMKLPYREEIDVSDLKKGMYIIVTSVNGRKAGFKRLIIK
jgi:hypothetical protein